MNRVIQSLVVAGMLMPAALFAQSSQMSSAEMDKLFKEGAACAEAKDYGKAVEILQKLANQGHAKAQCVLGGCYAYGFYGVPKDMQKAKYWLQKSADQGNKDARGILEKLPIDLSAATPVNGQDTRYEAMVKMHRDRLNKARIDIAGIVTDTDGVKLKDVDLLIKFSRPKDVWATHSEGLNETMKINESFSIRKEHYISVTILFLKKGYYPERITLYTGKKADESDSAIQTHFHVKLRKIGAN